MNWRKCLPRMLFVAAAVGFAIRLYLAVATIGRNDTPPWYLFAQQIRDAGLFATYRQDWLFNHPPLPLMQPGGRHCHAASPSQTD